MSSTKAEEFKKLFQLFDLNGDGHIGREDWLAIFGSWPQNDREELWTLVDKNGDGRINYDEFAEWVASKPENAEVPFNPVGSADVSDSRRRYLVALDINGTIIEGDSIKGEKCERKLTEPASRLLDAARDNNAQVLFYTFGQDHDAVVELVRQRGHYVPEENFYFIARPRIKEGDTKDDEVWAFPMCGEDESCYIRRTAKNPVLDVPFPEQVQIIETNPASSALSELRKRSALRFRDLKSFGSFVDALLDNGCVVFRAHYDEGNSFFRGRAHPEWNYCKILSTSRQVVAYDDNPRDWQIYCLLDNTSLTLRPDRNYPDGKVAASSPTHSPETKTRTWGDTNKKMVEVVSPQNAAMNSALETETNMAAQFESFRCASSQRCPPEKVAANATGGGPIALLSPSNSTNRHLILNFDVNCTIVMSDKIQNKSETETANGVLADTSWGIEQENRWVVKIETPSVQRPTATDLTLTSYREYIEKAFPGSNNKKLRSGYTNRFTSAGEPGEKMAPQAQKLINSLQLPDGVGRVFIIPAFFNLLVHLKRTGRSFTIVFRTFGEDLKDVTEELNAFCEGRHPLAPPDMRFDGSDGKTDYRVQPSDLARCGTFYRDDNSISLVMGTWWQPEKEKVPSLDCYNGMEGIAIKTGSMQEIGTKFRKMCVRPGTLAMRDYFLYWKKLGFCSDGGKPLFFRCSRNTSMHEIFFDDNIRFNDAFIVQAVDMANMSKKPWTNSMLRTHLCRAEPLDSILNSDYFTKELIRLEAAYERKLVARQNLLRCVKHAAQKAKQNLFIKKASIKKGSESYDAWRSMRQTDNLISLSTDTDDYNNLM